MTARKLQVVGWGLAVTSVLALGCTETPYSFFPIVEQPTGVGGAVSSGGGVDSGGGAAPSMGTGGGQEAGGTSSGGAPGEGGSAPVEDCTSSVDPARSAMQLRAASGLCVTAGASAPLLGEESFAVVLSPCAGAIGQRWTVEEMEYGAVVFANEAVTLNLDVRFAASDDGTPAVLFTQHRLYNQRFVRLSAEAGRFKLSPLHTPDKCMSERGVGLELWPCDPLSTDQTFEIIACDQVSDAP